MNLKQLEEAGACYDARMWFKQNFKQSAPTADVLFKAYEEELYSWIEWYVDEYVENMVLPEGETSSHMASVIVDKLSISTDPLSLLREFYPPVKKAKKTVKKVPKKPAVKAKIKKVVKKKRA